MVKAETGVGDVVGRVGEVFDKCPAACLPCPSYSQGSHFCWVSLSEAYCQSSSRQPELNLRQPIPKRAITFYSHRLGTGP